MLMMFAFGSVVDTHLCWSLIHHVVYLDANDEKEREENVDREEAGREKEKKGRQERISRASSASSSERVERFFSLFSPVRRGEGEEERKNSNEWEERRHRRFRTNLKYSVQLLLWYSSLHSFFDGLSPFFTWSVFFSLFCLCLHGLLTYPKSTKRQSSLSDHHHHHHHRHLFCFPLLLFFSDVQSVCFVSFFSWSSDPRLLFFFSSSSVSFIHFILCLEQL